MATTAVKTDVPTMAGYTVPVANTAVKNDVPTIAPYTAPSIYPGVNLQPSKRSADAEADPGYGYGSPYTYGYPPSYVYGKRSADAEADPALLYTAGVIPPAPVAPLYEGVCTLYQVP